MSTDSLILYIGTCLLAAISPGPGLVAVINSGYNHGLRKTLPLMFGLGIGLFIVSFIIMSGASFIVINFRIFIEVVKYLASAYVAYLGLSLFWMSFNNNSKFTSASKYVGIYGMLRRGVLLASINPKSIVFFSSLLPLFLDPEKSFLFQCSFMTLVLIVCTFVVHLAYVYSITLLPERLFCYHNLINRLTGIGFIFLAISLLLSNGMV